MYSLSMNFMHPCYLHPGRCTELEHWQDHIYLGIFFQLTRSALVTFWERIQETFLLFFQYNLCVYVILANSQGVKQYLAIFFWPGRGNRGAHFPWRFSLNCCIFILLCLPLFPSLLKQMGFHSLKVPSALWTTLMIWNTAWPRPGLNLKRQETPEPVRSILREAGCLLVLKANAGPPRQATSCGVAGSSGGQHWVLAGQKPSSVARQLPPSLG